MGAKEARTTSTSHATLESTENNDSDLNLEVQSVHHIWRVALSLSHNFLLSIQFDRCVN